MWSTPEFKVGLLVVVVSTLIGGMSLKMAEGPGMLSGSKDYWFDVEDAGGLVKNSAVKMAGIKVGIIEDIVLVNGQARVHLLLDDDVPLTTSSRVELRADGILGDKHVELLPGKAIDPAAPEGELKANASASSLEQVLKQVGEITGSLKEVAKTLESATKEADRSTTIGRILTNIETLTQDLSDVTGQNKKKVNEIIDQVHGITATLDDYVNDDSPEGFKAAMRSATDSLRNIDKTLKNAEEITDKINSGKGTLGRLVNDEETIENINTAVTNVNEFLGGATAMETSIDFHSEVLSPRVGESTTKSILNFRIQPGLDRYYEIGLVDDAQGLTTTVDRTIGGTTTTEEVRNRDRIKFNALFAKNFYDFTIKGGIMESRGGVGMDYYLLGRDLRFSVEFFDFEDLNIRAFVRYNVFKGIYLIGGGEDISDSVNGGSFVGGGIFITNEDLKLLATKFF